MQIAELRALLSYEPETGHLRWLSDRSTRARAGDVAGTLDEDGYIVVRIGGKGYKAHRLAFAIHTGSWPKGVVDHINRVRTDNRAENLRDVSPMLNSQTPSASTRNKSGVVGVAWNQAYSKWVASVTTLGRRVFLGYHDTLDAAASAVASFREKGCV